MGPAGSSWMGCGTVVRAEYHGTLDDTTPNLGSGNHQTGELSGGTRPEKPLENKPGTATSPSLFPILIFPLCINHSEPRDPCMQQSSLIDDKESCPNPSDPSEDRIMDQPQTWERGANQ